MGGGGRAWFEANILFYYFYHLYSASANCQNPAQLIDESIDVFGFREPATRGTNLTLACTSGLMLTGSNTSTCMGNGEWEPDPSKAECIGTSTPVHMTTQRSFEALSREGKIAVASSVTVFVVASILFFTIGFLCGHFWQKKRKPSRAAARSVPPSGGQTQIPYYDDVVLQQREQELELKENVAYGPVR